MSVNEIWTIYIVGVVITTILLSALVPSVSNELHPDDEPCLIDLIVSLILGIMFPITLLLLVILPLIADFMNNRRE